jgi:hypothetical protein
MNYKPIYTTYLKKLSLPAIIKAQLFVQECGFPVYNFRTEDKKIAEGLKAI